jgi:AcrR family transcriptional regulator
MATRALATGVIRKPLSRKRVLRTAIAHADKLGLDELSMRKLAEVLRVAPMALYRHIENKDDLIDSMIDVVFAEIDLPPRDAEWRTAMRQRAISVRDALERHRWAIGLMESRLHPGPANLRHHDAVLGNLRAAGFSVELAAHAYSVLDSYIYGFALTKMNLPFENGRGDVPDIAETMLEPFPVNTYPNLVEFITEHAMKPGYQYGDEFEYGLDLILDGIERLATTSSPEEHAPENQTSRNTPSAMSQIDQAM